MPSAAERPHEREVGPHTSICEQRGAIVTHE
jgi:hypothetical protein